MLSAVEELVLAAADLGRDARLLVVGAPKELHRAAHALHGHVVREEVEHAADGVGAVEQRSRTLHDLGPVDGKLVDLQAVVVAPLLSLVLDAVLRHHEAVEAQAAYDGLALPAAYGHGLYAGDVLKRLHEAPGEVLVEVFLAHGDVGLRHAHLRVVAALAADGDLL